MNDPAPSIRILIAEDNKVSRDMMAGLLETQGYEIIGAADGDEAIAMMDQYAVDLALVDINMAPTGGFEFVKHLIVKGIDIPVVIVTADESSDMLMQANELRVQRVLQKPIDPKRLIDTVEKTLRRKGIISKPIAVEHHDNVMTPEKLMARAVELAHKNAQSGKGGPFGAVVANKEGHIIGEGVNGVASRADPTAHAEVMAIRQAAEKLGRSDLSDCSIYLSSEPTMMGKALILSVSIPQVYFALKHDEVKAYHRKEGAVREEMTKPQSEVTKFEQLGHDEALEKIKTLKY